MRGRGGGESPCHEGGGEGAGLQAMRGGVQFCAAWGGLATACWSCYCLLATVLLVCHVQLQMQHPPRVRALPPLPPFKAAGAPPPHTKPPAPPPAHTQSP